MCLNHEVVKFQPRAVTSPDLGSDANDYTISNLPAPPVPTVFWIIFSSFLLGLSPIYPPDSTRRHRFYISLHPLLNTYIARSWSNYPAGRRPHLPAVTDRLRFPPLSDDP